MTDRRRRQEEMPLPRWPTWGYAKFMASIYATAAILTGLMAFLVMVLMARPMWGVWFGLGIAASIMTRKLWKSGFLHSLWHLVPPWRHVG